MGFGYINKDAVVQVRHGEVTCDTCGFKETCKYPIDTDEAYNWDQDLKGRWTMVILRDGPLNGTQSKVLCNKCLPKLHGILGIKP